MKKLFTFLICCIVAINCLLFCGCKQKERTVVAIDDAIAELTIYTFDGKSETSYGLMNLGHSFLSVKNISQNEITVGKYTLASNETVMVASWSIADHFGVWYNVESNYIDYNGKYEGRVSVTKEINLDNLSTLNNYILEHDYWSPLKNCSYFAINAWNSVAKPSEKLDTYLIYRPGKLKSQLLTFENVETNITPTTNDVLGYFDNNEFIEFSFRGGKYA